MKVEKKTWPDMFQKIVDGDKKFDLRLADFEIKIGDTLVLREYDPATQTYTGREIERKVTYVLKTKDLAFFGAEDIEKYGYLVMSLADEE